MNSANTSSSIYADINVIYLNATSFRPLLVLSEGSDENSMVGNLPDAKRRLPQFVTMNNNYAGLHQSGPTTQMCANLKESSYAWKIHYSFDFAQQVHFPSDPLQPGPIYFKCPRKCGLFGVACEAFPKQVNVMLDGSINKLPTV